MLGNKHAYAHLKLSGGISFGGGEQSDKLWNAAGLAHRVAILCWGRGKHHEFTVGKNS
jgi:hypothetical protein